MDGFREGFLSEFKFGVVVPCSKPDPLSSLTMFVVFFFDSSIDLFIKINCITIYSTSKLIVYKTYKKEEEENFTHRCGSTKDWRTNHLKIK